MQRALRARYPVDVLLVDVDGDDVDRTTCIAVNQ